MYIKKEREREGFSKICILKGNDRTRFVTKYTRIFTIDTYLSENILRAFQFVQEDNVHVDHVVDVMRLRERS